MSFTAAGGFTVKLQPLESSEQGTDAKVGRMSIEKSFTGDLVGTSVGEMLSGGSPDEGSAGYVAIERVTCTLNGKAGEFLLQHSGTMSPEGQRLSIEVIPGSGTGQLAGISGTMTIDVIDGDHTYRLDYALPSAE